MRVRLPSAQCKPTEPPSSRRHTSLERPAFGNAVRLVLGCGLLAVSAGCAGFSGRTVSLATLEQAPAAPLWNTQRIVLCDAAELGASYHALEPRLGLITIRTRGAWERLQRQCPDNIGPCPDLTRGSVVGLVCLAGLPLEGDWPISLQTVRIHQGAGLIEAGFRGGTYLPDGTTYVAAAYIPNLRQVLVVDINGLKYTTAR